MADLSKEYKDEKFDIVLLAGQSNSYGYGLGDCQDEYEPNDDVLIMDNVKSPMPLRDENGELIKGKDGWEILEIPTDDEYCIKKATEGEKIKYGCFGLYFADLYRKNVLKSGRKVLLVKSSVGGTGFIKKQWTVGGVLEKRTEEMLDVALSLNSENKLVGCLWHQGECDAYENAVLGKTPEYIETFYKKVFGEFLARLRGKYGKFPLIAGGFVDEWSSLYKKETEAVLSATREVMEKAGNCGFAESDGLLSNNQKTKNGDNIHFCRESTKVFGERYFREYEKMYKMTNAKWIWINRENNPDEYAEFSFTLPSGKGFEMQIACDGAYAVYVSGELVGFSACADYPEHKYFDRFALPCKEGEETTVSVSVWHGGVDTQTYISDTPGVIFEVVENGKTVYSSGVCTQSRKINGYKDGYKKWMTPQLGYSFLYDATKEELPFSNSVEVEKTSNLFPRERYALKMRERIPVEITREGDFYRVDLKSENAGFLELDFTSDREQKILISYGEHLLDGKVRQKIGVSDFSVEYVAKKGRNVYLNPFRRLAGRYLEFTAKGIVINYVGLRPVEYPVEEKEVRFPDSVTQKIYDTCVRTLRLCMHEHYEDCPWREQALYTLDSRNQMLCGYYAFKTTEYQRANLVLISKGLRSDGLLSICYPSGTDVPIPFFSLAYVLQVYEYVKYTGDGTLYTEVKPVLDKIVETFESKTEENGLIPSFPYPYWNFYEWAEYSNNEWQITRKAEDGYEKTYDLILNCFYVYVLELYGKMCKKAVSTEKRKQAIRSAFYDGEKGIYRLSTNGTAYSQFGNATAIMIGLGDKTLAEKILADKEMVQATLSVCPFVYDALLSVDENYKEYILSDIERRYTEMLESGATSFWETEKGADDFDGAGSLCHGWSAMPVYYFHTLKK